MKEADRASSGDESEEFSKGFQCCVCLDLLYKPIVLACGHISCFWCVHESMSGLRESHCPICRHPYYHFPTICRMLHFLLLKIYPAAYMRRRSQILEKEKELDIFSPLSDASVWGSYTNEELNPVGNVMHFCETNSSHLSLDPYVTRKGAPTSSMEQSDDTIISKQICSGGFVAPENTAIKENDSNLNNLNKSGEQVSVASAPTPACLTRKEELTLSMEQSEYISLFQNIFHFCSGSFEAPETIAAEDKDLNQNNLNKTGQQVSIADVLCTACKQLLFRPAVLNCGHVYCETCIIPADENGLLRCQACRSLDPRGFPKVCLELDYFLQEQFPEEYALRRDAVEITQVQYQDKHPTTCSSEVVKQGMCFSSLPTWEHLPWWGDHGPKVHFGVGCDSCGMYPIFGDRYKCEDCVEKIGFDLCGDCYNTHSKLPGRFNQQHTPEHKFKIVRLDFIPNIIGRVSGHMDTRLEPLSSINASENEISIPMFFGQAQEDADNDLAVSVSNTETAEDQSDRQSI